MFQGTVWLKMVFIAGLKNKDYKRSGRKGQGSKGKREWLWLTE